MPNLTLTHVEVLAGTDIEDAAMEAITLAAGLNVNVEFNFNGVLVYIRPTSSMVSVIKGYKEAIQGKREYVIV